jgi:hypothetical protein
MLKLAAGEPGAKAVAPTAVIVIEVFVTANMTSI